jgi:membrane-associated phospholipid phosphatase
MYKKIVVVVLLTLASACGLAPEHVSAQVKLDTIATQRPKGNDHWTPNKYDFAQFFDETGIFFTQPLRWKADDWLAVGLVGAATLLATKADQPMRNFAFQDRSYVNSAPVEAGRIFGELYTPIALFAGIGGYSLITGDRTTHRIAYELGQASLYGGALVFLTKVLVGRARPRTDEGPGSFHPSFSILFDNYHSFPSGHAAVAFVISTILARNVTPLWLKIICYAPAVLTPISRIYQDWHWTSDVVMGAAIGYFFGKWVVDRHEEQEGVKEQKSSLQVTSFYPLTVSLALP